MTWCLSGGLEKITSGWDNHSNAVPFSKLEPPWFKGYAQGGYSVEWQGQDEKVLASDRMTQIKLGLPSMRITFPILHGEEIIIIGGYVGQVSLYALDQDYFEWYKYNAILLMPDVPGIESKYEKKDFTISFIDLQYVG